MKVWLSKHFKFRGFQRQLFTLIDTSSSSSSSLPLALPVSCNFVQRTTVLYGSYVLSHFPCYQSAGELITRLKMAHSYPYNAPIHNLTTDISQDTSLAKTPTTAFASREGGNMIKRCLLGPSLLFSPSTLGSTSESDVTITARGVSPSLPLPPPPSVPHRSSHVAPVDFSFIAYFSSLLLHSSVHVSST